MDIDIDTYVDLLEYDMKINAPKKTVSFSESAPPINEEKMISFTKPTGISDDDYLASLLINDNTKVAEFTGVSKSSSTSSYINLFGISLPMAFIIFLILAILLIVIIWLCSGSSETKKPKKDSEKK